MKRMRIFALLLAIICIVSTLSVTAYADEVKPSITIVVSAVFTPDDFGLLDTNSMCSDTVFGVYAKKVVDEYGEDRIARGTLVGNLDYYGDHFETTGYLPVGDYYVQTVECSQWYVANTTKLNFSVTDDIIQYYDLTENSPLSFVPYEQRMYAQAIDEDFKPVANVGLEIRSYGDGSLLRSTVVYSGVSNDCGVYTNIPSLTKGTYLIREYSIPSNYKTSTVITSCGSGKDWEDRTLDIDRDDYRIFDIHKDTFGQALHITLVHSLVNDDKSDNVISDKKDVKIDTPTTPSGDADNDGIITANDALIVLRASLDLDNDNENIDLYDIDMDGVITANDALLILRESVSK